MLCVLHEWLRSEHSQSSKWSTVTELWFFYECVWESVHISLHVLSASESIAAQSILYMQLQFTTTFHQLTFKVLLITTDCLWTQYSILLVLTWKQKRPAGGQQHRLAHIYSRIAHDHKYNITDKHLAFQELKTCFSSHPHTLLKFIPPNRPNMDPHWYFRCHNALLDRFESQTAFSFLISRISIFLGHLHLNK